MVPREAKASRPLQDEELFILIREYKFYKDISISATKAFAVAQRLGASQVFFTFSEEVKSMLGIPDPQIWLVYLLCILSAALCVVYGIINWNNNS